MLGLTTPRETGQLGSNFTFFLKVKGESDNQGFMHTPVDLPGLVLM